MQDVAEFTTFVKSHGLRLQRFGFLLTGDAFLAEDLIQSALSQALRHWDRIENREGIEAYVRRTMINKQRASWRRLAGHELLPSRLPETAVGDNTSRVHDQDLLARALRLLPQRQRTAVILRFCEDMSEADVAVVMECSVGTVKSQTSRGLAKLRAWVEAEPTDGARYVDR